MQRLTHERLKSLLSYDPNTGHFVWRVAHRGIFAGTLAGSQDQGRVRIRIDYKEYKAARLAVFYMTGCWPINEVDHINQIAGDDRYSNLREATHAQNCRNITRVNTKPGLKGTSLHKRTGRYTAQVGFNNKKVHLGYFSTPEAAHAAYCEAAAKLHGEFFRSV